MTVPEDRTRPRFRLLVVPGVTVERWGRDWARRRPGVELLLVPVENAGATALLPDQADAGLVRLPVDGDTLHAIPLYTETTVVVVPRDHPVTAADEVTLADLVDEVPLRPLDDVLDWAREPPPDAVRPATTPAAVELVAAGVGVLVVPQSLARRYHRRDLTYRPVTDAPTSRVALVWPKDRHTDLVEEMIGVVRGRTANSTRGTPPPTPPAPTTRSPLRAGTRGSTPRKPAPRRRGR